MAELVLQTVRKIMHANWLPSRAITFSYRPARFQVKNFQVDLKTNSGRLGLATVPSHHRTMTDYFSTVRWNNVRSKSESWYVLQKIYNKNLLKTYLNLLNNNFKQKTTRS